MDSNREYIVRFMTRSFEKSVDYYMLSDKNYVVPQKRVKNYIDKILSIPYSEYIDYIKDYKGIVNDDQLTQSSSFAACSTEMCSALESQGNPGLHFVDIGKLFPQYVKVKNEAAFRKYGENQIKTSTQLGLTFEYYGCWYLTCVGYIFNDLEVDKQKSLLARTILRIPLYQSIIAEIQDNDVDIMRYMQSLSASTIGRRSKSIVRMINLCLNECRKEGICYHNLIYPNYKASEKKLIMAIQDGFDKATLSLNEDFFSKNNQNYNTKVDVLTPRGSVLYNIDDDYEVRTLIHNMMALYDGTTIMQIVLECQREFQHKYFNMRINDWRNLLRDYVKKTTLCPQLQDDEIFRHIV